MNRGIESPASTTRLPRTVIVLGFVSFLNDLASEMVVPLIPILLVTTLGGGAIALGLIEGVADALASFLKLWAGRLSDRLGGRRKGLALAGYLISNVTRPLLGLASHWTGILVLRSIDRVGKGVRGAPRDALVADTTPPAIAGYAYGFHRALDNGGAVLGSLAAAAALAWWLHAPEQVILLSAVPGACAVLLLAFGVRERKGGVANKGVAAPSPWRTLSPALRRYLLLLAVLTFGRASEAFIVLRAHELGIATTQALLLWAALNLAKAVTATAGGRLADRIGRPSTLALSWGGFGASFLLFAWAPTPTALWAATLVYGLTAGAGEGAERAQVSDIARPHERGTAFGWYHLVTGLAAIPAGLVFGVVWRYAGAPVAFAYAGALVIAVALLLRLGMPKG